MLLEVPFENGFNEFLEYFAKEISVEILEDVVEYLVELEEEEVDPDSLAYNLKYGTAEVNLAFIELEGKNYLEISSINSLKNLKLEVQYTYKNKDPKELYSINYAEGILYFSEELDQNLEVSYEYDNLMCYGKSAKQLLSPDFNIVGQTVNIKNHKENSTTFFLYKKEEDAHRNITPVIQNLKLNYIIKDDISL